MASLQQVIEALRSGKPVVFPTDTVYGIGVAVRYAPSPDELYAIKRRDAGKPIAWLVDGASALDEYGADVPAQARELAGAHWPGALTLIVKASPSVPDGFQAQAGTIGLRMPANEVALALVRAVGPIAASSANLSGGPDPRTFSQLDAALLAQVAACVEADGNVASGVASTVVDCSGATLHVVRAGDIILP